MVDSNDRDSSGHICYNGPEVAKRFLSYFFILYSDIKSMRCEQPMESYMGYWIYSSKFKFPESRIQELKKEWTLSKLLEA